MNRPLVPIEVTRAAWRCAASFSASKEAVYPDHAKAQEFDLHVGKDVLEYGCGGGSDAMSFLRRGNRVTYADVTHFNVRVAQKRIFELLGPEAAERARPLELADSAPLPLPGESFDIVSSHGVIHHIADPEMRLYVLREFRRVLRPGGLLYVMLYSEHLRARLDERVSQLVTWRGMTEEEAFCALTDEPGCPYARAYDEAQGRELFEAAGFKMLGATLYNADDFRTFKATKEGA